MFWCSFYQLQYRYGNRIFWRVGQYVRTASLNEGIIRKYIREQEREDIMLDKRTSREYTDPFSPTQENSLRSSLRVKVMEAWPVEKDRAPIWEVQAGAFKARVSNNPLQGWTLHPFCGGRIKFLRNIFLEVHARPRIVYLSCIWKGPARMYRWGTGLWLRCVCPTFLQEKAFCIWPFLYIVMIRFSGVLVILYRRHWKKAEKIPFRNIFSDEDCFGARFSYRTSREMCPQGSLS